MKSLKGVVLAIISSGTFGLIALFSIPLLEAGLAPGSILFYRFLISTIIMGVACLMGKHSLKISKKHIIPLLVLGVLYASTTLLLLHSYRWLPSGITTTIHFLYPILVSFLMVIFFKEKRSLVLLFAAILSLAGVILMCWTDAGSIQSMGIFTASFTIVTYALYIVGINQTKTGKEIDSEPLTFYILFIGMLFFFLYAMLTGGLQPIPSTSAFGRIVSLAVFATVISDLTLVMAIKYVGSTVTSILGSMEPLVAMAIGVLYFSETFTGYTLVGAVLIIFSVCLVISKSAKSKQQIAPPHEAGYEYEKQKQ